MKSRFLKGALCLSLTAGALTSLHAQVIDKTPFFHMSFDNVNGTNVINDGTGGTALNGAMFGNATIVPGKFGNALSVTGTAAADASVRIANAIIPLDTQAGSNAWSVAMWFQTTVSGGCFAYQGNTAWSPGNSDFYLTGGGNGGRAGGVHAGAVRNGQEWEEGSTPVNDGVWHHFVLTFDGTNKFMYLDGASNTFDENSWAGSGTGNQFWIGGNPYNGDGSLCLNGLVDEVYLFKRALSLSDVKALNDSNTVPVVPVTLTVAPVSGYRGQVITLTATATPATGFSVTNAKVDLSALALSATSSLVLSNNNVFTNTFTIPANSPIGAANLKATVIDNEPLAGSGGAIFTVIARPPTNSTVLNQLTGPTNFYTYTEVSYTFNATNDSPDHVFPMDYAWYKNGVRVSTNAMGPNFTFLTTPADNGATISCVANIRDTNYSNITVTSGTITMVAQPGALVYTNGLKREFFPGATRQGAEIGDNVKGSPISLIPSAENPGINVNNYAERYSGYFIPPTNGNYVFFVAGDDDTDVYLSTDNTAANKRLIAQETGFSSVDNWLGSTTAPFGSGSIASQKRSDQWTNSVGTAPFSAGIPLQGGQLYYFESVHHQGQGGDNWAVTYSTVEELLAGGFINGTPSLMTALNTNIATVTWPGTNIVFTQSVAGKTVFEGDTAVFYAVATSDAEMIPNYTWYVNGVAVQGPTPNGTNLILAGVTLSLNNAQISVVASTEGLAVTNGPVTLTVQRAVFEIGYAKDERWQGLTTKTPIENGTVGNTNVVIGMPGFEESIDGSGTGQGDFSFRMTAFYMPPVDGNYNFFISSDDDSDLFLSTDDTSAHKRLIAQETAWSNTFSWLAAGNGPTPPKRSDQFIPTGATVPPNAGGIPLLGGHKYYIEVDHHNGSAGGTHMGVYAQNVNLENPPANGVLPNLNGTNIGFNVVRSTVAFSQQPVNASAAVGGYATFSALGTSDSQVGVANSLVGNETRFTNNTVLYQWYKNGLPIANANAASLTIGPMQSTDAGAVITCQIRSLGYADGSFNPIWLSSTPATVTITTAQQVFEPGYAQHDVWTNQTSRAVLEGGGVGRLPFLSYASPKFEGPAAPTGAGPANYVQRISSYFTPPSDNNYALIVNSDNDSDLFLSTDTNRDNMLLRAQETGATAAFQWNTATGGNLAQKNSTTWSADGAGATGYPWNSGIALLHSQKYYIELDHHNGGAGNNAEASFYTFSEPNPVNGDDTRLTNNLIGIYVPRVATMAFTLQPVNQTTNSGGNSVTFSALGVPGSPALAIGTTGDFQSMFTNATSVIYQWYKNGSPIPGANSNNYTLTPIVPADNNAQFVCRIRSLGYADNSLNPTFSNSLPATLTVITETTPPLISYVATFQNTNTDPARIIVDVTFNEWMDTTTAQNIFNYNVAGASVISATLAGNHRTVELVLNQAPTLPLNITVNNVQDVSGNPIAANSTAPINPVQLTFSDIGNPGNASTFGTTGVDPAYPSLVWIEGTNGFLVSAEGSDIFGIADGCNFGWELKTNDFDVVVRVVSNGHTSNYAKAGLMVREDLTKGSRNWSVVNDPASADGIQAPDNSGFGNNTVEFNARLTNSIGTINLKTTSTATVPRYPNAWVRIKRVGNVLTTFASSNAVDWVTLGINDTSTNINGALPSVAYVGIATTAHNNDSSTANPPPPPYKYYNTADYADYNSSFVALANPATLLSSRSGTNIVISWSPAGGHLEGSPVIGAGAVWQNLGSVNPATIPMGTSNQYFRVVNP